MRAGIERSGGLVFLLVGCAGPSLEWEWLLLVWVRVQVLEQVLSPSPRKLDNLSRVIPSLP
jgi:hypothetical protein